MTTEMAPVTVAVVEPSSFFEGGGGVEEGGVAGVGVSAAPPSLLLLLLLLFSGCSAKVETTRRDAGLRWCGYGVVETKGGGGAEA